MTPHPCDLVVTSWGATYLGMRFPVSLGRSGIGEKIGEGDGITPVGTFEILEWHFRKDRVHLPKQSARPIGVHDIWSDDPKDPNYNKLGLGPNYTFGHETLRRADRLYDIIGVMDFNYPDPTPGAGSAIFVHQWRKPRQSTEGCIAFSPEVLRFIAQTWQEQSRVVIRP